MTSNSGSEHDAETSRYFGKMFQIGFVAKPGVWLLPGISGLLSFASLPSFNQGYLAWIALVPLAFFVDRSKSARHAFEGGFVAGVLQFFFLLIWIPPVLAHYGSIPVPLAWILYALMVGLQASYQAAACYVTRLCIDRLGRQLLLAFPLAWVTMEYARNHIVFGGFPWLLTGYSQTEYLTLIQIADITGVYGVSFMILWVNTALAWAAREHVRMWRGLVPLGAALAVLVACLIYGAGVQRRWGNADPILETAILQGNLSFDEPEDALASKFSQGYVKMAAALEPSMVELLVLPESPSPLLFQHDEKYRQTIRQLARRFPLGLIFNNISYASVGNESRYFNSAYFLGGDGEELGRYDKIHLVPFGEYIPLKGIFFFAETISKDVGGFTAGSAYTTIIMGGHPVNAIICFEAVFPELVRDFVRRGSHLIVNLTNDGWYGDSSAPYQHLAMARWRAVENRRYLIRAANTGISAVIEPTGRLQVRTGLLREEVCVGRFSFLSERSFYTRHGDVFSILCVIITCLFLLYGVWVGPLLQTRKSREASNA